MNVAEQVKNVNAECHPITDIDSIIIRWLDRGQKIVGSSSGKRQGWSWLRQYGYTLTTAADTQTYALSPLVDTSKIITMYSTDTPRHLDNQTEAEFRRFDPGAESTGDAYLYRLVGYSPVQNQPSAASVLSFVSTSDSDTAVVVNIQGLNGSGVFVPETVTLNGTTPVSSTHSYTKVMSLSKSAGSVGTVTVTSNAAAVTNVAIAPKDRSVSHPMVSLYSVPDSVDTIYYDFTMALQTLSANDDISLIPEKYHDVPELYAIARCFKHLNNDSMFRTTYEEFKLRIKDMIADDKQPSGVWSLNSFSLSSSLPVAQFPSNFPRT